MKEEWLMPGAVVPVDPDTTKALVDEIKRLIGIVGGMALQATAPVPEPVAIVDEDGVIVVCNYKYKPGDKLYTTPPAAPVPEPVAFNAGVPPLYPEMKDGETISVEYTTPPAQPAPVQEPVALPCCGYTDASAIKWNPFNGVVQCHNCGQTYTPPAAQRQWVGLTDEEFEDIELGCRSTSSGKIEAMQKVEAKLKEKNT